jgi:protein-disulfide isomerase
MTEPVRDHPDPEQLMAWLDGEAVDAAIGFERHINECRACAALIDDMRDLGNELRAWTVSPVALQLPTLTPRRRIPWGWFVMTAIILFSFSVWIWSWAHVGPEASQSPAVLREPVLVEVFIDWQCPTCVHLEYPAVIARYEAHQPGAVKYVLRDYPLSSRCNPHVPSELHPAACDAAIAMRVARERGKADELADWLISNQPTLTPQTVRAKAASLLGVMDFDAEYAKRLPEVTRDIEDGTARHITFTPSVFINGRSINNAQGNPPSPEALDRMIQELGSGAR